ncbi:MAG TPA: response regulator [Solirubrobacterales bacterium]|nr:response regulator [Solirubrobacterales bacterium]
MNELDPETLAIAREEATECLERIERNLLALEGGGDDPELIDALFRDAHSVKGAASMVGWTEVASIAHGIEDGLEGPRDEGRLPKEQIDPLLKATDELRRAVDAAGVGAGEETAAPPSPTVDSQADARPAVAPAHKEEQRHAMRVDPGKVDRMLDAVGEAVLHRRRFEHIVGERILTAGDDEAEEELDLGERLLGELQDAVIEMRTLPLSTVTAPFPRAVRDLANAEGKEIDLMISGAETQLDRVILEGITDPIVHLLRNAVAHGIEDPDEREQSGKPRRGTVELRAEQLGGTVAIQVADDGRGVSAELLERANELGSLADMLTTAGFSTAVEVGDLAGRGVGLDSVKSHVEALGGSIEVRSEPGRGMEVSLLVPVTLAVLKVLLCERGGQPFGLPVASVREVVTVKEAASLGGQPCLEHRGETVPIGDLAGMIGAVAPPLPQPPPAVILATATRAVAVACDRVLDDRELVVKGLGPLLANVAGYLGAGILEDGRVALILDPNRLLEVPSGNAAAVTPAQAEKRAAPKVLVVDDQFSVRQLQRSILEAAGYRVETARHGREALEKIAADPDLEMVLTDVQMPEMDGFELLGAIRKDPEHGALPVAIITSKGSDEDKRRGAAEGADAYIVKKEFNQQALLETVGRLVGG